MKLLAFFGLLILGHNLFSQDSIKYVLVKNINTTKSGDFDESSYPLGLIVVNDKIFFTAVGDISGSELYISDGTIGGTHILKNINANFSSHPYDFTAFGKKVIFGADDGIHGYEPWVSDGTANGTFLLKDILTENYGSNNGSNPASFTVCNDKVFFLADTWRGRQLFVSDGTPNGTLIVKEVPGATSIGGNFISFKNRIFFNYSDHLYNNNELWWSDGTESGTGVFKDISDAYGGSEPSDFVVFNNKLYFSAYSDSTGREMYVTDGNSENTSLFADINRKPGEGSYPSQFQELDSKLYFTAADSAHGTELWCTDGDTVFMVKDISAEFGSLSYSLLQIFNHRLYFNAKLTESSEHTLWTSDGTEKGTFELLAYDSTQVTEPKSFINWQGNLVFKARRQNTMNTQLWITDGTVLNTNQIFPDSISGWNPIGESEMVLLNNEVFFSAKFNDTLGMELYKLIIDTTDHIVGSMNNSYKTGEISAYPNPVSNHLCIRLDDPSKFNEIRITDVNGVTMLLKKSTSESETIDVSNWKRGIYFLIIVNSGGVYTKKIVKNRP